MLKNGGPSIQQKITILFKKIINTGIIVQEWEISITIFKKRQKKNPNSYRGITLLSSILKIFEDSNGKNNKQMQRIRRTTKLPI